MENKKFISFRPTRQQRMELGEMVRRTGMSRSSLIRAAVQKLIDDFNGTAYGEED